MVTADDTNALASLIQPEKLRAEGFKPIPNRVSIILGRDHTGEEAYHVYLVFPNKTSDSELAWRKISPMVRWVQEQISIEDGYRRFPYVNVKRESELGIRKR
jgi:hypothetical protein